MASANPIQDALAKDGPIAGWETLYRNNTISWDKGDSPPALRRLVASGQLPAKGTALCPGVGSGYDVFTLATAERPCLGVDVAPSAVAAAEARRATLGVSPAQAAFLEADFFTFQPAADGPFASNRYDVIWDLTFFCAIPIEWRPRWAARMAELLALDGVLATLVFPIADHKDGPPFAVRLSSYEAVLQPAGLELVSFEKLAPELCAPGRANKEGLALWKHRAAVGMPPVPK